MAPKEPCQFLRATREGNLPSVDTGGKLQLTELCNVYIYLLSVLRLQSVQNYFDKKVQLKCKYMIVLNTHIFI